MAKRFVLPGIVSLAVVLLLVLILPKPGEEDDHIARVKAELCKIIDLKPGDLKFSPISEGNEYIYFTADNKDLYAYNVEYGYVSAIAFNVEIIASEKMIDINTAKNTALSFLQKYYPMEHFAGMKLIRSELSDHGSFKNYDFQWRQEINGILGPNFVSVGVNPYNGNVLGYSSKRADVTITDFTPGISKEEVVALAESIFYEKIDSSLKIIHSEACLDIWLHRDTGKDYLRWTVSIEAEFEDEAAGGHVFEFDAITGELVFP